jgi:hypothetical protein
MVFWSLRAKVWYNVAGCLTDVEDSHLDRSGMVAYIQLFDDMTSPWAAIQMFSNES